MSAAELIRELKALPPEEQAVFAELFQQLEVEQNGTAAPKKKIEWPDIEGRQRRIMGDRVLPENMVLWARDQERY